MKVKGIEIPQAAIDAGRAAMTIRFMLEDVRIAVASVLRPFHDSLEDDFDYGPNDKDVFDDRLADRLIQEQKNRGHIRYTSSGWVRQGCPQPRQTADA